MRCLWTTYFGGPRTFTRWFAVNQIFWDLLPTLSVYSAMRLLYCIVPTIFLQAVCELIGEIQNAYASGHGRRASILQFGKWVCVLIFSVIVGFDTFLMKLRIISAKANHHELKIALLLGIVQFLVQVLGVVQLGPFVRKRLFVFIFGGEDGQLQDEEKVIMNTWLAMVIKRMYDDLKFHEFIAVACSFSDEDFQSLVMNENAEQKRKTTHDMSKVASTLQDA